MSIGTNETNELDPVLPHIDAMHHLASAPIAQFAVESQPVGFCTNACEEGETASVLTCGFFTDDQGFEFTLILENLGFLLSKVNLRPGAIAQLLAVLEPHQTTIYANESLQICGVVRAREDVVAGQAIYRDQIAEFEQIQFPGVIVPENAGVVLFLSRGWRRGVLFDFRPCNRHHMVAAEEADQLNLEAWAGELMTQLTFTEYFFLSDDDWESVLRTGWFPFMFLAGDQWSFLFNRIRTEKSIAGIEQRIQDRLLEKIDNRLRSWLKRPQFARHQEFLERGVDHFKRGDWLSCASVILPRIEGILADCNGRFSSHRQTIESFCKTTGQKSHRKSLLFAAELQKYFFATLYRSVDFNSTDAPPTVSRHTLGHGVASASAVDGPFATRLLLLIDHLFYCLPRPKRSEDEARAEAS